MQQKLLQEIDNILSDVDIVRHNDMYTCEAKIDRLAVAVVDLAGIVKELVKDHPKIGMRRAA